MTKMISLLGLKFGRLTVVSRATNARTGASRWDCVCECGCPVPSVVANNLKNGHTRSCGCLKNEESAVRKTTHGMSGSKEHKAWKAIHDRCTNQNADNYYLYGGRGVSIDPAWSTFEAFYADMGLAPSPSHSVERKDNDGPYSPGNCVWATKTDQANNRRTNRVLDFNGVTKTMAQWCRELGMSYGAVQARLDRGWSVERALTVEIDTTPQTA